MPDSKIILIIDDDPDDKEIFLEILNEVDPEYKCIWGRDGRDGINKLLQMDELPTYVFLDLNMPRMNGKQCLAEIKQMDKFINVPVIIYSTSKLESDIQETKNLGASFYLTKPSLYSDLKEAIQQLLSGHKPVQKNILQSL